ncbi:MAG: hypothetical protein IJ313_05890 [Clostridia bacterium]|nr:hypothetical protein [Clostridia bacterium]
MDTVYLCDPEKNADCCARSLSCAYNAETPREQRICISTTDEACALEDGYGRPRLDPFYAARKTI